MEIWLAQGSLDKRVTLLPKTNFLHINLACEQSLRGPLAAGREKEGELATSFLEFEFHHQFPCGSSSTELSHMCANQRKAKTSVTVNKQFASTFSMQIFKFQRRSCKVSFLFPPCRQSAPESFSRRLYKRGLSYAISDTHRFWIMIVSRTLSEIDRLSKENPYNGHVRSLNRDLTIDSNSSEILTLLGERKIPAQGGP